MARKEGKRMVKRIHNSKVEDNRLVGRPIKDEEGTILIKLKNLSIKEGKKHVWDAVR